MFKIPVPLCCCDSGELRLCFLAVRPVSNVRVTAEGSWPLKVSKNTADALSGEVHKEFVMSVSGIFTSNLFHLASENVQNRHQKFAKEFEQLGKDLQSGDLSAAQADFAALQQLRPQNNSRTSSTQNANPLQADFAQLSTDLKAGNTSAAQKDYATILQDMQNQATQVDGNHHHRHASQGDGKAIEQSLQKLGQALQANDLTTAQQAYTALQQEFQQVRGQHGGFSSNGSGSNSVSVNA